MIFVAIVHKKLKGKKKIQFEGMSQKHKWNKKTPPKTSTTITKKYTGQKQNSTNVCAQLVVHNMIGKISVERSQC